MSRSLFRLAVLAALLQAAGFAAAQCNDACRPLLDQGHVLSTQGKLREAWDAYQRAAKADPASSIPVSSMADMLAQMAAKAQPDRAPEIRKQAEALAREALRLNQQDPLAQETLRRLTDDQPAPVHAPSADAMQAAQEGEALFAQKRYAEAQAKYELALQRDPRFSGAMVYAGDCFYAQKEWREAALRFRKATEIEPLNGQAWRFLADALVMQGDRKGAEAALYGGIAAQPSQRPNWDKLEALMKQDGMALRRLALVRRARYTGIGKDGKSGIEMNAEGMNQAPETAFWLLYAGAVASASKEGKSSPFEIERHAWELALSMVAEMKAKGEPVPADPALVEMAKLADAGQLEPAILLLMYREAYRPEFEAWKKAHPDGIRAFVVSTGLRP